jgi:hypothetical protein
LATTQEARDLGILTFFITYEHADWFWEIAGSRDRYFVSPTIMELQAVYSQILRTAGLSLAGNLFIDDEMGADIEYVTGSARPRAQELTAPPRLRWARSLLPATGITLSYRITPTRVGLLPTNRLALAKYTDFDGVERFYTYPVPVIEVVAPTATPTPRPPKMYLPITLKRPCVPGQEHVDVVLVIDSSASMAGNKLAAAKAAARTFVSLLDLPTDRAAVIRFNTDAKAITFLTGNRTLLNDAIDGLNPIPGTRIDLGLREATKVLRAGRGPGATNLPVVLLLSDGVQQGPKSDVLTEAALVRALGARIFTVGLGQGADEELLRRVADPGGYYFAPNESALDGIYRTIVKAAPCPISEQWP